jgi:LysM repeat protein
LNCGIAGHIFGAMKRFSLLVIMLALANAPAVRAQDAATEERINKLNGTIADLRESQDALKKHIERLAKEIEAVREQALKPTGNYAGVDDLKTLAKSVEEVDRKRIKDYETIDAKLQELKKILLNPNAGTSASKLSKKGATTAVPDSGAEKPGSDKINSEKPPADEKGYPYTIKKNDTLDAIVQAYKEKNIKVTVDQILKANPGLVPERMRTGQKIWIPAPPS